MICSGTARCGRACQPVSHHGTSPATVPGASTKKTELPTADVTLLMARGAR